MHAEHVQHFDGHSSYHVPVEADISGFGVHSICLAVSAMAIAAVSGSLLQNTQLPLCRRREDTMTMKLVVFCSL
jgi:hypothetical protein